MSQADKDSDIEENDEKFVWPWTGIMVNIPIREARNGRYIGVGGLELKNELIRSGFDPVRVRPLWNWQGHSGNAVVEFKRDWVGFHNALLFERAFEADGRGRVDWYAIGGLNAGIYGWVARESDCGLHGVVGEHLTKVGDLKTVSEVMEEKSRREEIVVSSLKSTVELKTKDLQHIQGKCNRVSYTVRHFSNLIDKLTAEISDIRAATEGRLQRFFNSHEKFKLQIQSQMKELELCELELKEREARNDRKRNDVKMLEMEATLEQQKVDQDIATLVKDPKRQNEALYRQIAQLERQLEGKRRSELEIEQLRGTIEIKRRKLSDSEECPEKEGNLISIQVQNKFRIVKEPKKLDKLREACQELFKVLKRISDGAWIGTVSIRGFETRTVPALMELKCNGEQEAARSLSVLCFLGREYMNSPHRNPFEFTVNEGNHLEVTEVGNAEKEQAQGFKNGTLEKVCRGAIAAAVHVDAFKEEGLEVLP